ncbi:unnamed protein product, partial [Polarella glacialis]
GQRKRRESLQVVATFKNAPACGFKRYKRVCSQDDMLYSTEGKLKGMSTNSKASQVEEIYQLFLTYVQGIHVGRVMTGRRSHGVMRARS